MELASKKSDAGHIPSRLYKYRSLSGEAGDRLLQSIIDSQVYLPSPSTFNDIFDCRPVFSSTGSDDDFIRNYIQVCRKRGRYDPYPALFTEALGVIGDPVRDFRLKHVSNEMQRDMANILARAGIYCLSEKRDDLLMWAHYADNHRGICLEFDGKSPFMLEAMRVIYTDRRPSIDQLRRAGSHAEMEKALLTKSSQWSYEAEWRIIHQVLGTGFVSFTPSALTGVIFGAEISHKLEFRVREALLKSGSNEVKLYRATADDTHFELNIEQV